MTGPRPPAADYAVAMSRVPRPNPLVLGWRWRYELLAVAAAAEMLWHLGPMWTLYIGLALGVGTAVVPPARRHAVRRFWCVLTPHRFRTGCKHALVHSRGGRLPSVLWTRSVPDGERLLVWCPAGTTAGDLVTAAAVLTTACWARDVRVEQHPTRAHLVRVTVLRRAARPPAQREEVPEIAA